MKSYKNIISVLLIISLICCITPMTVVADSSYEIATNYSSVAHHHFEKIGPNIPKNYFNSCGYVSMSMLLSFYDSYWHDSFVAEVYENNGAKPEYNVLADYLNDVPLLNLENEAWLRYKENGGAYPGFIEKYSDTYLHMKLLSIGINRAYHIENLIPDRELEYSITIYEMGEILDEYFDGIFGEYDYYDQTRTPDDTSANDRPLTIYSISELTISVSRDDVIQKIINQVQAGNPVIYRGTKIEVESEKTTNIQQDLDEGSGKKGHFMIAYDLETQIDTVTNEEIVNDVTMHMCYTSENPANRITTINTTEYDKYIDALWIEINEELLPHTCPTENEEHSYYNYVEKSTGKGVCSCQIYGEKHPKHKHEILQLYSISTTQHNYRCICGKEITEEHEHTLYQSISNSLHYAICKCGYRYENPHSNLTYRQESEDCHIVTCEYGCIYEEAHNLLHQQVENNFHILVCECGYQLEEAHNLSYNRASDDYHRRVCECGYSFNEEHTLTYQDYHTDACVCGYTSSTPHNFIYQEGSDENHHIAICECGYNSEVWHTWTYTSTSASHHSCICPCGYTLEGESHVFEQISIRYLKCKFCGYIRDNLGPGGNVIMGAEENEEKE